MPVRKLPNGRYQADVANKRRGLERTKRTFDTQKEAKEWEAAVKKDLSRAMLGLRRRRLFGEALAKYIEEHAGDAEVFNRLTSMSTSLRWPYWSDRKWNWLELLPLEDMISGLHSWVQDMKAVRRRRYVSGRTFHQRAEGSDLVWYEQPDPTESEVPAPRVRVTDAGLIAELQKDGAGQGRGPFSNSTLRQRQLIVRETLKSAYKPWKWSDVDHGLDIELIPPGKGSTKWLTPEELRKLANAAPDWLRRAIYAAAWIGWRRNNVLRLEWSRVIWPVRDDEGNVTRMGVIFVDEGETKNGDPLGQPMSERVEELLRECWDCRRGPYVFHLDGVCVADIDFKRRWVTLKRKQGIPRDFRWHDLRHTWASHMTIGGTPQRQLQLLGGWRTASQPANYQHLNLEHLRAAVDSYKNIDLSRPKG